MTGSIPPGGDVAVIGAGIVGVCCAAELADAGYRVHLIDRAEPGTTGPSKANAAHIAGSSILPLASPATFKSIPRLLLDRHSPLLMPMAYWLGIVPWLVRFAQSCRPRVFKEGLNALAALNDMLWPCTEDLYARAGITQCLTKTGAFVLYESEDSFRRALGGWALVRDFGIQSEPVSMDAVYASESNLARRFTAAVSAPSWGMVSDPLKIVTEIAAYAQSRGATLTRARVTGVVPSSDGVDVVLDSGENLRADGAVIAAGAWSGELTRRLGERIPLETERGYNLTMARPDPVIHRALVFADRGMVASQLEDAFRVGGLDELGGLDLPPNPALYERVRHVMAAFFPDLDTSAATPWMGHRPSMPDARPVIGRARRSDRILYAFGHGHFGLTHGPATGRLIADLATGTPPAIDLAPFDPGRI